MKKKIIKVSNPKQPPQPDSTDSDEDAIVIEKPSSKNQLASSQTITSNVPPSINVESIYKQNLPPTTLTSINSDFVLNASVMMPNFALEEINKTVKEMKENLNLKLKYELAIKKLEEFKNSKTIPKSMQVKNTYSLGIGNLAMATMDQINKHKEDYEFKTLELIYQFKVNSCKEITDKTSQLKNNCLTFISSKFKSPQFDKVFSEQLIQSIMSTCSQKLELEIFNLYQEYDQIKVIEEKKKLEKLKRTQNLTSVVSELNTQDVIKREIGIQLKNALENFIQQHPPIIQANNTRTSQQNISNSGPVNSTIRPKNPNPKNPNPRPKNSTPRPKNMNPVPKNTTATPRPKNVQRSKPNKKKMKKTNQTSSINNTQRGNSY